VDRLERAGLDADVVERAVADLERVGLVDDDAFARELVAARTNGRFEGDRAVRAALRAKGIDPGLAERSIEEAGLDEQTRAEELARRRAPRLANLPPERAYGRLVSLLQRRGHGYAVAATAARRALAIEADAE
jgi:regulatory protein